VAGNGDSVRDFGAQVRRGRSATDLSEREWEVALLVASRSNREIADELVVNRKTAEAHVSHILTKLGLRSRVQLATLIVQGGPDALGEAPVLSTGLKRSSVEPRFMGATSTVHVFQS
jgi:DNA-binding CsgD family transcriptional regulator